MPCSTNVPMSAGARERVLGFDIWDAQIEAGWMLKILDIDRTLAKRFAQDPELCFYAEVGPVSAMPTTSRPFVAMGLVSKQ